MKKKRAGKEKSEDGKRILGLARNEWRFLAKFAALFSVPYIMMRFIDLGWLTVLVAGVEGFLFNAAGIPSSVNASILVITGREYEIIPDCTGLVMIIMLSALLWSAPVTRKRRWLFMAAGIPFLFAFNLARLFFTLWTGTVVGGAALDAVHVFLWFVDAGVVVGVWAKAAELW